MTIKAVQFDTPGEPARVLQVRSVSRPQPGPGEVLVRMLVSPVNPSDMMFIRGHYTLRAACPAIPGFEGVGVVEAAGGGFRGRLFVGRRVVVLNPQGGNWAEYAVVPASNVIPISSTLSDQQAATFFVNPATAWVMTREVLRVPAGQWLVQTAAGSALGRMVIRLGRICGFRTFCVIRRPAQAAELRQLGADHVEVCADESAVGGLPDRIRAVVGSSGVFGAIDAVGGSLGSAVINSLGKNGRMLAYGTLSGQPLSFHPRTLMTVGSSVEGFWLGNFMASKGLMFRLSMVRRLTNLIRSGVLQTNIAGEWDISDVGSAVRAAEDSDVSGKCLLRIS